MANQAWQITSPRTLTLNDLGPIPKPQAKQVLVRIYAVSLNYRDRLVIDHSSNYPTKAKENLIPGSDGAGIVEETGSDSIWKKGDRVVVQPNAWLKGFDGRDFHINTVMGGSELDGTFRRWMVVDDQRLFRAPDELSLEEACTLHTAGATAYRSIFHGGMKLGPGTAILAQGTGGVSCYAILIAAAAGATVVATSSSDEKLEIARKLGATHLINYRKVPDWASKVIEVTDGKGVDMVVDVVGAEDIEQTLKCTAFGGIINSVGLLGKEPLKRVNVMTDILYGAKTLRGQLGAGSREMAMELSAFMDKHKLHPPIASTFEFEEAGKALEALDTLSRPGKIVIRV